MVYFDTPVDLPVRSINGVCHFVECFAASESELPPDRVAISGLPATQALGVSVDDCLKSPGLRIYAPDDEVMPRTCGFKILQALLVGFLTCLLFLPFCARSALGETEVQQALLPGTPGNHPLFNSTPDLSILPQCPEPAFDSDPDVSPFGLQHPPHLQRPPDDSTAFQFVQTHQPTFLPVQGLHATLNIIGHARTDIVNAGIETLSDTSLALRDTCTM
jgi:hypothetical protein